MSEKKPGLLKRLLTNMLGINPQAQGVAPFMWGHMDWASFVRSGVEAVQVTEQTARSVSAVVACTNLIGGTLASMPVNFYRRGKDDERSQYTPNEWFIFNERPHWNWSASSFWQYLSDSRLLYGDAFAFIHRKSQYDPTIIAIEPWHPLLVDVRRYDGRLKYRLTPPPDHTDQTIMVVDMDDMLHIPGPGFNGLRGLSQLQFSLRNAAGIAQAADDQSATWYGNGARPDFAIEVPGLMAPEASETLRKSWIDRHTGQGANKAPVVLAGGMKLHQLTMSSEDSQLLSARSFQVEEICRVFGVPPHMVGHSEKTSSWGSGVEQMGIGFVKYTMQRHLIAFEQEINYKLFKTARNYVQFLTAGLERADLGARNTAYRIALGRAGEPGWMTVNEVRAQENLPSIVGGDALFTGGPTEGQGPQNPRGGDDEEGSPNEPTT